MFIVNPFCKSSEQKITEIIDYVNFCSPPRDRLRTGTPPTHWVHRFIDALYAESQNIPLTHEQEQFFLRYKLRAKEEKHRKRYAHAVASMDAINKKKREEREDRERMELKRLRDGG